MGDPVKRNAWRSLGGISARLPACYPLNFGDFNLLREQETHSLNDKMKVDLNFPEDRGP